MRESKEREGGETSSSTTRRHCRRKAEQDSRGGKGRQGAGQEEEEKRLGRGIGYQEEEIRPGSGDRPGEGRPTRRRRCQEDVIPSYPPTHTIPPPSSSNPVFETTERMNRSQVSTRRPETRAYKSQSRRRGKKTKLLLYSRRPHDKALGELTGARRKALANKDQSRSAAMHAALAECSTTQQHLAQAMQSLKASTEWKQLRIQYRK
ncbi:hypothetical protein L1887_53683 [Cichorium endivia]|nr:hypothetical protein L1887_53683 [Cichorium endivia]